MRAIYQTGRSSLRPGAVVLLAIAAGTVVASAQGRQLRLVSTPWPPFTNATGQVRFALDLVESALGRVDVAAQTTIVEPAAFTTSLLEGQFDGSAAAWRDPTRERMLLYSEPYLENRLILVGRKGANVSVTNLSALKGRKIAIVEGYSYGAEVDNAGPAFVRSRSEEDSITLLLKGSVDYTLIDDLVVQYILAHHATEALAKLELGLTPLVKRPLHLAVRRSLPDSESIITRFNSQLRNMIVDGTYHRLLHVDWIRADVDGDGVTEYVPASNRAGTAEPKRAYMLLSNEKPPASTAKTSPQRFYVGGSMYDTWTAVPSEYKVIDTQRPETMHTTAPIFKFIF